MALPSEFNVLSVCSGGGGLDAGIRLAIPNARTVCYLEREAPAVAALVAGMEKGALDEAPVWSDASTFDGRHWRGVVDCVAGGTPCQDMSVAGKRAGLGGSRSGLFWKFRRIVRQVRPRFVLWENVGGATSALPTVGRAFARAGYRGAWVRLSASDVGASHGRARVFALFVDCGSRALGNAHCAGLEGRRMHGCGCSDQRPVGAADRQGWPVSPPGPADVEGWGRVLGAFPELAPALPQPALRGVVDGMALVSGGLDRIDLLRLFGNGVVPRQAADAIRVLWPVVVGEE